MNNEDFALLVRKAYIEEHPDTFYDIVSSKEEHIRRASLKLLMLELVEYALGYKSFLDNYNCLVRQKKEKLDA